jgi:hypothetical protein
MNIYFAGSITGGRTFESVCQSIVKVLIEDGHEVPTTHSAESSVMALEAVLDPQEA